jgi:biotin carboxylase
MEKVIIFIISRVEKIRDVVSQLSEHSIIILTSPSEAELYSPQFKQDDRIKFISVDMRNNAKITDIVENISREAIIENIVAIEEGRLMLAAKLRDIFSVKGMSYKEIIKFRNKFDMKKVLINSKVYITNFQMYKNELQAEKFLNKYKKIVIKPVTGAGSADTYIIDSITDLKKTTGKLKPYKKYIVERFIKGDLYHCDSVVKNGEILFTNIMLYILPTLDFKKNNFLAAVSEDDEDIIREINKAIEEIIKDFKIENGVTHTEVFVDENKKVTFGEIGLRTGGAAVEEAVQELYGVNLFSIDVLLQTEREIPTPTYSKEKGSWITAFPKSGRIKNISKEEDFLKYEWVKYIKIYNKIGDVISAARYSGDFIAKFVVTGESKNEVILRCKKVMDEFTVEYV